MIGIVVVVGAAVVIAGLAWAARRRGTDEVHSVEGYRHTLDTLSGIRARSSSPGLRVRGPDEGGEGVPTTFEDVSLRPTEAMAPLSPRRRDRAMTAMHRGPRRMGAPLLVAVVAIAIVGAALAVGLNHRHPHPATRPATGTTQTSAARTTTTQPARRSKKHPHRSSTTTVPQRFTPLASTSNTATYRPPANSYTVVLTTTTSECWVTVSGTSGTIFTETLAPGQTKTLPLTGAVTVIIGAPSALTVSLDHEPVVLPAGFQTPFTMSMRPTA